jgi:hypothetical protein
MSEIIISNLLIQFGFSEARAAAPASSSRRLIGDWSLRPKGGAITHCLDVCYPPSCFCRGGVEAHLRTHTQRGRSCQSTLYLSTQDTLITDKQQHNQNHERKKCVTSMCSTSLQPKPSVSTKTSCFFSNSGETFSFSPASLQPCHQIHSACCGEGRVVCVSHSSLPS